MDIAGDLDGILTIYLEIRMLLSDWFDGILDPKREYKLRSKERKAIVYRKLQKIVYTRPSQVKPSLMKDSIQ